MNSGGSVNIMIRFYMKWVKIGVSILLLVWCFNVYIVLMKIVVKLSIRFVLVMVVLMYRMVEMVIG